MAGMYETYTTHRLLNNLRTSIEEQKERFARTRDVKIRLMIKELKTRDLGETNRTKFRRLVDRFISIL